MNILKNRRFFILLAIMLGMSATLLAGCSANQAPAPEKATEEKGTIIFGDAGWDSFTFHNQVAGAIVKYGYGYDTDFTMGSTAATFTGLRNGDIDVYMETWTENIIDVYNEGIEKKEILDLSVNYGDNAQGLYVPTYVIKGDPQRGIEPMAPDLKTVKDLEKYWKVFEDPEEPGKGRIYGAIPGWMVDEILMKKVETYGLNKTYSYFSPGSEAAMSSSIAGAVEQGKPWVGYYWEPTWVMGKYDMTLLADEPYSDELWNNGYACEMPSMPVTVTVNSHMVEKAPDVVEFLKHYKTSSALTSEALAYMQDNDATVEEAANWFLKEHEDVWTAWVSAEVADKVKEAIR